MTKRAWRSLLKEVKAGDILIIPHDTNHNKPVIGSIGRKLSDPYEVEVLKVYDWGFITTLVDAPAYQPLSWTNYYNFKGAKIKK